MRGSFTAQATAAGVALASLFAGVAHAGERLVMPFVCTPVGGGAVELDPSEPRGYPILGRREQDMVTSCSPADPNRCKTWRVHRFDISCAGQRVSWLSVVAAASDLTGGPALLREGRMYVQMGPWWAPHRQRPWGPPPTGRWSDDPTYGFERPNFDRWERTQFARGGAVEMPPGFAPAIGVAARFEEGPPGPGDDFGGDQLVEERSSQRATVPPPVPKPERNAVAGWTESKPATAPKEAKAPSKPEQSAEAAKSETKPAPAADTKTEAKPEAKSAVKSEPVAAPLPPSATASPQPSGSAPEPTGTSGAPRIINAPGADSTSATPNAPPVVIAAEDLLADKKDGEKKSETAAVDAKGLPMETGGIPVSVSGGSASDRVPFLSQSWQMLLSVAAVALTTMMLFAWMRRGERSRLVHGGVRDLGAVSLGGAGASGPGGGNAKALTLVAGEPSSAAGGSPCPVSPQPAQAVAPDWLPRNRAEALQVLGASPDASLDVLKKIADGLRQSWHPDLARDEFDRIVRERRMKQINVAWELIQRAA